MSTYISNHTIVKGKCITCGESARWMIKPNPSSAQAMVFKCECGWLDRLYENIEMLAVKKTSRQVIERKLLTALDDKTKVAILATQQDLEDMIFALESYNWNKERKQRCNDLASGLQQLLCELRYNAT